MQQRDVGARADLGAAPYFHGRTADEAWSKAVTAATGPMSRVVDGRGGPATELLHCMLRIDDPTQRWIFSRRPGINPAFAIVEAFWILGGRDDAGLVNFWNPALPRYAGTGTCYPGAYGGRLRRRFGFDQVSSALDALDCAPTNRQTVLQIWDPDTDFPKSAGTPASNDIPCNVCAMPKVRDGRLEWMQVMRSNDLFRGTPYNIVQFTVLQEYMAGCLGLKPGAFVHVADSLHAYASDLGRFRQEDGQIQTSTSHIALPRKDADAMVAMMLDALDRLAAPDLAPPDFMAITRAESMADGHANLLRIAAADSARRRRWFDLASYAEELCLDPGLRQVWDRWSLERRSAFSSEPPACDLLDVADRSQTSD